MEESRRYLKVFNLSILVCVSTSSSFGCPPYKENNKNKNNFEMLATIYMEN